MKAKAPEPTQKAKASEPSPYVRGSVGVENDFEFETVGQKRNTKADKKKKRYDSDDSDYDDRDDSDESEEEEESVIVKKPEPV